mgnify:CR=1 FL=1
MASIGHTTVFDLYRFKTGITKMILTADSATFGLKYMPASFSLFPNEFAAEPISIGDPVYKWKKSGKWHLATSGYNLRNPDVLGIGIAISNSLKVNDPATVVWATKSRFKFANGLNVPKSKHFLLSATGQLVTYDELPQFPTQPQYLNWFGFGNKSEFILWPQPAGFIK